MKVKWLFAAVLVLTGLVYVEILKHDFVWDDLRFISEWQTTHYPSSEMVKRLFTGDAPYGHGGVYRPVRGLLYALSWQWWGNNPLGYHLQAIITHLVATAMVMWLGLRLSKKKELALVAGLIFGLHPVHIEAVSWATASFDTVGLLLALMSFVIHKKSRIASLVLAALAFFTYEMTLVLPLWLLLYWWLFEKSNKKLLQLAPYWLLFAGYWLVRSGFLHIISRYSYPFGNIFGTLWFMLRAMPLYLKLFLFPFNYTVNYFLAPGVNAFFWADHSLKEKLPEVGSLDLVSLGSLVLTGFLVWLIWVKRKKAPLVSFCLGWFLISLLPVWQLFPLSTLLADRYLYLGSVGLSLAAAYFLVKLPGKILTPVVLSIALLLSWQTITRNRDWQNNFSLWKRALAANPTSSSNYTNLGEAYYLAGDLSLAKEQFIKAVQLNETQPINWLNLGIIAMQEESYAEAFNKFNKSIEVGPNYAPAHLYLGTWYHRFNELNSAEKKYFTALTHRPLYPEAYLYLGMVAHQQLKYDRAIERYRQAIGLKQDYADAFNNLGNVYRDMGDLNEAEAMYRKAILIDPSHKFAAINLQQLTE